MTVLLSAQRFGRALPGWQFVEIDPDERLAQRRRQRMYLARYGRQDYYVWEDKDVQELDAAARTLSDILGEESSLAGWEENRG